MKKEMEIFVISIFFLSLLISKSDYFLNPENKKKEENLILAKVKINGGDVLLKNVPSLENNFSKAQILNKDNIPLTFKTPLGLEKDNVDLEKTKKINFNAMSQNNISEFSEISFEAKSVYIFNIDLNKEIFSKNADLKLPLASIVKLMTAVAAKESFSKNYDITISDNAVKEEGESGFMPGEKFKLNDLISAMLVGSINDAAYAIFEFADNLSINAKKPKLITFMNNKARELNMKNTVFVNSTGLDLTGENAGGMSSSRDISILVKYILENHYDTFYKTREKNFKIISLDGVRHEFKNTNILLNKYPNIILGKTGYTEFAGGNFVFAFETTNHKKFVVVILGSTYYGRFNDAEQIINLLLR